MSDEAGKESIHIDSPLHQIKRLEEAITETGGGMVIVLGIEEFAREIERSVAAGTLMEDLEALRRIPEVMMLGRPENAPPVEAMFILVDQPLADELSELAPDESEQEYQED